MRSSTYKKASSKIAKRQKARKYAGLVFKLSMPTALIVGLVFLLRANFLQVKNFEVLGAQTVSAENIKNVATAFVSGNKLLVIPKSDILLLSKNKLASSLLSDFPRIEKVEVKKDFFNKSVTLSVTERKAEFLWCSPSGEYFSMTKDGLVFEKLNPAQIPLDKIIFKGNLDGSPLMKNFDTPAKMQNYAKFIDTLKNAGFDTSSINIESEDRAVTKTSIGDVIFSPIESDLSVTAQNVVLLINQVRSKNPSAVFNYIDARFDNKMFYKLI